MRVLSSTILLFLLTLYSGTAYSFIGQSSFLQTRICSDDWCRARHSAVANGDLHDDVRNDLGADKGRGDPFRAATGIRPSLHPITINAISSILSLRAKNSPDVPLRVVGDITPLQVALSASKVAADIIASRQATSIEDGMTLTSLEERTVAGRIVGVTMRLDILEPALHKLCSQTAWIAKYNEWGTFGLLPSEENVQELNDRILQNPLFCLSRAECLLALFLKYVEEPELNAKNETVPGGSGVDFLDADRSAVLLESQGADIL